MNTSVRNTRDLWAGLLYSAFGGMGLYIGTGYRMGTAAAMGPGYFPTILSGLLIVFGLVSLIRALLREGEDVSSPAWKAGAIILGSIALFAFLLEGAGFVISLSLMLLVSASASTHFQLRPLPLIALAGLVGACALIFIHWLRIPMPLLGTWFGG